MRLVLQSNLDAPNDELAEAVICATRDEVRLAARAAADAEPDVVDHELLDRLTVLAGELAWFVDYWTGGAA